MSSLTELTTWIGESALGVTLVDQVAKATILLLAAWGISRLLRRASAATRHQMWTAALVTILALPLLSRALPAWRVPIFSTGVTEKSSSPINGPMELAPTAAALSAPVAGEVLATAGSAPKPGWLAEAGQFSGSQVLPLVWGLGALILLARLLVSSIAAWRVVRESTPVSDGNLVTEVKLLCRQLGIRSPVTLVENPRLTMPMAWGVFRQTVLLPSAAHSWTDERQRVVLLHELAHLKRWDCQTLLLARVVTALHWFNPLAWIAVRRLQAEREHACDDLVLTAGTPGPDYAQHLLDIARAMRSSLSPNWAMVAMARPSELEGRLLAILDPDIDRGQMSRRLRVGGLVAIGLLVMPLASLQPRASAEEETSEAATAAVAQLKPSTNSRLIEVFAGALQDEDSEVRAQAARSLGSIEDAAAVPFLDKILRDDVSEKVREQAAWALGMIESVAAVPVLRAAISDPSQNVRKQAAWALGMIESDTAVPALRKALTDTEAVVREQAAWALGMIESDAAADLLGATLNTDDEARVRKQAAWALGMIESATAIDSLTTALTADLSPAVREQAAWALGMIEDKATLDTLLDAMSDDSAEVRKQALWAVGRISG